MSTRDERWRPWEAFFDAYCQALWTSEVADSEDDDEPVNTHLRPIPPGVTHLDAYRVAEIFEVTDPALFHALKKLLGSGSGDKTRPQEIEEVIQCCERWLEMLEEDEGV